MLNEHLLCASACTCSVRAYYELVPVPSPRNVGMINTAWSCCHKANSLVGMSDVTLLTSVPCFCQFPLTLHEVGDSRWTASAD